MKRCKSNKLILFSVIEMLYFGIFAISSYQTLYLQNAGLTSSQIGMIVSISSAVGMIATPIWGIISDRMHSAKTIFLICIAMVSVLYAALPIAGAAGSVLLFAIYIPIIFVFKQASNSMLDSWCIGELTPEGISYGSARMWGSIGYCVVSVAMGYFVGNYFGVETAFVMMVPMMALLFFFCSRINRFYSHLADDEQTRAAVQKKKFQWQVLLKNQRLIIYLIYALGLNIYLAVTLIFMPYILNGAGCHAEQIGTVTGFRALVEIVSMFLGAKLSKRFPTKFILILPGIFFCVEHFLYAFANGLVFMLFIMICSGLAGGFFYSLGPSYIYEIVPEGVVNTAQTLNAMDMTIVSIIGVAVGGIIIEKWGVDTLTTGCGVLILCLTVFFTMSLFVSKKRT